MSPRSMTTVPSVSQPARERRHFLVNPRADPAEDGEDYDQNRCKTNPKLFHVIPSARSAWQFQDNRERMIL